MTIFPFLSAVRTKHHLSWEGQLRERCQPTARERAWPTNMHRVTLRRLSAALSALFLVAVLFASPPRPASRHDTLEQAPPAGSSAAPEDQRGPLEGRERALQEAVRCVDKDVEARVAQRGGDFWVLYNYAPARRRFRCWESVTYTTHADYTFLDNLRPLLERWRGPVSIALHAPGKDLEPTLESIMWARACVYPLVTDLVTFHIFFNAQHVPRPVLRLENALAGPFPNCSAPAPWTDVSTAQLYKARKGLLYPINVGRNIAREMATTHFVLPSDIELYPSPGLIDAFLDMIVRDDSSTGHLAPRVFTLRDFEVQEDAVIPSDKTQLVTMLKKGTAVPFHMQICPRCHGAPRSEEWNDLQVTEGLHVFHIGKRVGAYSHWEPFYIGTNREPLYDERLSWEGKSDKILQGYALCLLDYEFHILDNAFLVHKPGIKHKIKDRKRQKIYRKSLKLILKKILPEMRALYGDRKECAL